MSPDDEPFPFPFREGIPEDWGEEASEPEDIRDLLTFLHDIVENIPLMVFVKDAEELRFQRVNRAAERLMGLSREELIGKTDFDFFPDEQAEFFVRKDRQALDGKELIDIPEEHLETPHGTRILHTKKIPILGDDGEPRFLLGISEDVTERKAMRRELVRADRMASLGTLAAGVAHEISNPLSFVITDLHVLREQLSEVADEIELETLDELITLSDKIEQGLDRVSKILSELRTFSHSGAEELGEVDVCQVLETVVSVASPELDSDVRIVRDYDPVPPAYGDTSRLQQVFMNLFINAMHAIEAAPAARDHVITLEVGEQNDMVTVAISDTGEGIPDEKREHVFEPFFTTKPVGQGTGLGLSICHGIVTSMDGEIDVDSTVGEGTTVTVHLPLYAPREEAR